MTIRTSSGKVENLRLESDRQNLLFGGTAEVAQGAAVAMAALGMAGAAVQTSMNADAFEEDITIYTFDLGGETYRGYCWEITFAEGDEVTVAYQIYDQGFRPPTKIQVEDKEVKLRDCLALIRPSTRSIWVMPHIWAGSKATRKDAFRSFAKECLWISLGMTLLCGLVLLFSPLPSDSRLSSLDFLGMTFGIALAVCSPINAWVFFSTRSRILKLSKVADEIFLAFGFDDPRNFDLIKTTENHQRLHNIPLNAKTRFHLWY